MLYYQLVIGDIMDDIWLDSQSGKDFISFQAHRRLEPKMRLRAYVPLITPRLYYVTLDRRDSWGSILVLAGNLCRISYESLGAF